MLSPITAPAMATSTTPARLASPREAMTPPRMMAISPGKTKPTNADASRAGSAKTTARSTHPCRPRIQPTIENASAWSTACASSHPPRSRARNGLAAGSQVPSVGCRFPSRPVMTASKKHLLPRFAVSSLVAFVAVGFVVSAVISSQARDQTEAAARDHARFVTSSILAQALTPRDLRAPMDVEGDRYRTLRHLVQGRILHATFPVVRVKIWRADGTILFADDPELVGRRFEVEEDLHEALHGEVASDVTDLSAKENVDERGLASKLFETYVPLYLDSRRPQAVVEVYSDIDPVSSTIGHSFKLVGLALLAGLAGIYLLQLPIVRRLGKALGDQNRRLQDLLRTERETVARLEELNRLKGAFVDVASHE